MFMKNKFQKILSIILIIPILFSAFQVAGALAQSQDSLKRQINVQTGRISFIVTVALSAGSSTQTIHWLVE